VDPTVGLDAVVKRKETLNLLLATEHLISLIFSIISGYDK